jgi:hypothetical protein
MITPVHLSNTCPHLSKDGCAITPVHLSLPPRRGDRWDRCGTGPLEYLSRVGRGQVCMERKALGTVLSGEAFFYDRGEGARRSARRGPGAAPIYQPVE